MADKRTTWTLWLEEHVTGPLHKITRQATVAEDRVARLAMRHEQLEQRAGGLQRRLTGLAVGVGVFAALSYGSLQFEERMAAVNTMAQKGQEEFADLTNQVRDLAEIVPIARTELADGLYNVISAGVPENSWIQFLEDSVKTAKGGQAELGTTVTATTAIIKNYQLAWEDAIGVQDKLIETVRAGEFKLSDLASALPQVAGNAAMLGVSTNELLGTFSALTNATGSASEVGTQLAQVLNALIKPTSEAKKTAAELGMQFNALAIKEAGGLEQFLVNLTGKVDAFSKATGRNAEEIYANLFGSSEAIRLILNIVGPASEKFQEQTARIAQASGAVNSAYNTVAETTLSNIQKVRNAFSNTMDRLVEMLAPVMTVFFGIAGGILKIAQFMMDSAPGVVQFIVILGAVTTALVAFELASLLAAARLEQLLIKMQGSRIVGFLNFLVRSTVQMLRFGLAMLGTAVKGLGAFIISLVSATAAQIGLNVAMTANPIGVIIVGIGALIAGIVLLIKHWDLIKEKIIQFGRWLIRNHPFALLIDMIDKIFPGFKEALTDLLDWVIGTLGAIGAKIKGWWSDIKAFFGFGSGDDDGVGKAMANAAAQQAISIGEMLDKFAGMQHAQQVGLVNRLNKQFHLSMSVDKVLNYREMYKQGKAPGQPGFEGGTGGSLDGGGGKTKSELVQGEGIKSINMTLHIDNRFEGNEETMAEQAKERVMEFIIAAAREASLTLAK